MPSRILMNTEAEKTLRSTIFPELEKGRPGWDMPHTEAVVYYIKQIMKNSPEFRLDPDILVTAAYAHDWGYSGMFESGRPATQAEIIVKKEDHMAIGAQKIQALLQNPVFIYLTNHQKQRIIHLVSVHDKLNQLKDPDELVLMEADTLGVADPKAAMPTHTIPEYKNWLKIVEKQRISKFITKYSKQKVKELLNQRAIYYQKHNL
jgi:HD superfamily phosphodiesterase